MNQSFYFFYHMTKFLKNILNQSETNLLMRIMSRTRTLVSNHSDKQDRQRLVGGAMRDRTADLLRARQALSQLSYGPIGGSGQS